MKAVITRSEHGYQAEDREVKNGFFGKKVKVAQRNAIGGKVVLDIQLTEEEKAAIEYYGLMELVMENDPAYTPDQIEQFRNEMKETKPEDHMKLKFMETARHVRKIGDYLKSPYQQVFESPLEAAEYYQKLRNKVLPNIASQIKFCLNLPKTETLDF